MSKEKPEFWSCKEDTGLESEIDNAISDRIDDGEIENGDIVTVFGFDKMTICEGVKDRIVESTLETIYEELAEDYEHEDYQEQNEPSSCVYVEMVNLINLICEEYTVTNCKKVSEIKVKILDIEKCEWEVLE